MTEADISVSHKDRLFHSELSATISEKKELKYGQITHKQSFIIPSVRPPIEFVHGKGHDDEVELIQEDVVLSRIKKGETRIFEIDDKIIEIVHRDDIQVIKNLSSPPPVLKMRKI